MFIVLLVIGGTVGALVALAGLLAIGLGPVAALMIFWFGGLAATLALAISFAKSTALAALGDPEAPSASSEGR